ncbi:MAG: ankyrin repeat domain-containing protein, partial [Allorhizobium sp.]
MFDHVANNRLHDVITVLDAGCPINLMDPRTGDTALLAACRHGWLQMVELCLSRGASCDPHPSFGQTALHAAVACGHAECAGLLLATAALSGAD